MAISRGSRGGCRLRGRLARPSQWTPGGLLSWIKSLLAELGVRPSKRLGQSFLYHPRGFEFFTEHIQGGSWLEVGTGPGLLTLAASRRANIVLGVELDYNMACAASSIAYPNASIVVGDGVRLLESWSGGGVYSNTPYHLSSTIISRVARNNSVEKAVLGVQKEVAYRILASPGGEEYGRLTLLVRRYFYAKLAGVIPRRWFYPPPEVDGAVIVLSRRRSWRPGDEVFEQLTACLFSGRNKLAYKMAERCACIDGARARRVLGDKRVRELDVGEVEWILENGECTSGRG